MAPLYQTVSSFNQWLSHSCSVFHQRDHDQHIMDALIASTNFSTKRMKCLNYCWLYLQVTLLSELTNEQGTHLLPFFWCGSGPRAAHPLLRYPRQGCPSNNIWTEWCHAIRRAFCIPYTCRLRQSLGRWHTPSYHHCHLSGRPVSTFFSSTTWHARLQYHLHYHLPLVTLQSRLYHSDPISIMSTCTPLIPRGLLKSALV